MKKFVSILLVCLFVFTGVMATTLVVSADVNVNFTNADFDKFINTLVTALHNAPDRDTRSARFRFYLDTICSRDSEIDARIAELDSGSALTDIMLKDLTAGGMEKEQIKLVLQIIKSLPEEERAAAVQEYYENKERGRDNYDYDFVDPDSADYNESLATSYSNIYDKYIYEEFQGLVYEDYNLKYMDFVPFFRVVTDNIQFTTDSNGRIAVLAVSDAFAENIMANVTADTVNGDAIVDEYSVLDQVVAKFSEGVSEETNSDFVGVFRGEEAYEIVGNISGDEEGTVDLIDATFIMQYLAGWESAKAEAAVGSVRYNAGAQIRPEEPELTMGDALKLMQYKAGWDNIILGRPAR